MQWWALTEAEDQNWMSLSRPGWQRYRSSRSVRLRRFVVRCTLLLSTLTGLAFTSSAHATPVTAQAQVSTTPASGEGTQRPPQDEAIARARLAALGIALRGIKGQAAEDARKEVLAHYEIWTSSYRIVDMKSDGDGIRVTVEVDIDVPRLEKQLAPAGSDDKAVYAWGGARVSSSCEDAGIRADNIEQSLTRAGALRADAPERISIQLECKSLGPVSHTYFQAARIDARIRFGSSEDTMGRAGFANDASRAHALAYAELLAELVDRLATGSGRDLQIRIHEPWPARRLRHLERILRNSISGVENAQLVGISAEGDAILRVRGRMDAKRLGESLSVAQFPGFEIEELRVSSKRVLSIRFAGGPGDQPMDTTSDVADPAMLPESQ